MFFSIFRKVNLTKLGILTFDTDKAPLNFWINVTRTTDEIEHTEVAENNLSIEEYKQKDEVTIPQIQTKNEI